MNQPRKIIQIGKNQVDEDVVRKLLMGDKTKFRPLFESISVHLVTLCSSSNVLKAEEPIIKTIENNVKVIFDYISLFEKALNCIPSGLSPSELMANETVKDRLLARNRLKNMQLRGFIELLTMLVNNLEYIIVLHNNPNILYRDVKIDNVDHSILMNKSVVLSDFEKKSMCVSTSDIVTKSQVEGHGSLLPLFSKLKENIEDKNILVQFEVLYDEIQNTVSLAEDLLISDS